MAEYSFLLGSGVSLESGVQSVTDITEAIFGENYWEHTDGSIIKGEHPSKYLREHYDVSHLQDYLKILHDINNDYLHARYDGTQQSNFEDLYDLALQIYQEAGMSRENAAIKLFHDKIQKETLPIRKGYHGFDDPMDLRTLSYKTMGFIETVIKYGLNENEVKGLDVLTELIENGNNLQIFSLNHDLLVEKLCVEKGFSILDGFSDLDGEVRWYKPSKWDEEAQLKIYKLHGSRDWSFVLHHQRGDNYAILTGRDKWHNKDAQGEEVQLQLDRGYILTGQRKSENYYTGIHGEIHYRFTKHLKSTDTLIVSGYGWNDIQMNWKIFDWLESYDNAKLVIIHRNPEEMGHDSRHTNFRRFEVFERQGKVIFIKKWFQDVELEDILKFSEYN
jgi:hypothetical protein